MNREMEMRIVDLKCPECNAPLQVNIELEQATCNYCGNCFPIEDESKFTYRKIDEAEIRRAETERDIRIKEIEADERGERRRSPLLFIVVLVVIGFACWFVKYAFESYLQTNNSEIFIWVIGICGALAYILILGLFFWWDNNVEAKKKRVAKMAVRSEGGVRITDTIAEYAGMNCDSLSDLLKIVGFTNIKMVPLRDLETSNKKDRTVDTLTINGSYEFEGDDWYPCDSLVVIMYHSLKE